MLFPGLPARPKRKSCTRGRWFLGTPDRNVTGCSLLRVDAARTESPLFSTSKIIGPSITPGAEIVLVHQKRLLVGIGPSPDLSHEAPAKGLPWRSTTRPETECTRRKITGGISPP